MNSLLTLRKPLQKINSTVWTMSISHLLIEVYLMMHISLIPVFIKEFDLTLFQISFLVSIPTLVALVFSLFSGIIVDKVGAKPVLILSMCLQVFGGSLVAECWNVVSLFLGVTLIWIASPLYHNSGLTAISTDTYDKERSRAMGTHNALGSFGAFLGLISLSIILIYDSWRLAYLIWIIPISFWAVLLFRINIVSDTSNNNCDIKEPKHVLSANFLRFLCSIIACQIGTIVILTFMTSYMVVERNISEAMASLIFSIGPLIGIFSSFFAGYASSRVGDKRFLFFAMLFSATFAILIPFASTISLLATAFISFNFFSHSMFPPITSIIATLSPSNRRGLAYSVFISVYQIVFALTPPITAKLIEFSSLLIMFPLSFLLIIISMLTLKLSGIDLP